MLMDEYAGIISRAIEDILGTQREKLLAAAELVSRVIEQDGLIYIFGCGHSHILAEECFYRAGGLANTAPILCEPLMLHRGAAESSRLEKQSGLAETVLESYTITEKDMLFCLSTSDKNAVPVELAAKVRAMGIPVVGIGSGAYADDPVHNAEGKHLHELCELWIDNMAPHGDACLLPAGAAVPMAPLSTVTGSFILNSILAEGTQLAITRGAEAPVYISGNIEGGAEHNRGLIERYSPRIPHL